MKKLFTLLLFALLIFTIYNQSLCQVNVTPSPATYTTLASAFTAINSGIHGTGTISITVTANTTEPAAAVLNGGIF
ncbi:MAG: hypothetical protein ABI840_06605, partial [bacterium]